MASELLLQGALTGQTVYAVLSNGVGQVWNGAAFEAFNAADWTSYAIAATEQTGTGRYVASMPAAPAGVYYVGFRYCAGGAPVGTHAVTSDLYAGGGCVEWDGSILVSLSSRAAPADVPTAAANADALLGRNIKGGSSTGRTVAEALAASRNKVLFDVPTAGSFTVYDTDDTTPLWTGTYTRGANSLGPLVGADPG